MTIAHGFRSAGNLQPHCAAKAPTKVDHQVSPSYVFKLFTGTKLSTVTVWRIGKGSLFCGDDLPILWQQVLFAGNVGCFATRCGAELGQYR